MTAKSMWLTVGWTAGALMLFGVPAQAQELIQGRTASDNAQAAGARAPGNMVSNGLSRAQQAAADGRATVPITQTASTAPGPRQQFLMSAAQTLVDQLNQLLLFFVNRFLARAGLQPVGASALLPGVTTGTAGTGPAPASQPGGVAAGGTTEGTAPATGTVQPGGGTNMDQTGQPDQSANGPASGESDTRDGGRRPGRRPARKLRVP